MSRDFIWNVVEAEQIRDRSEQAMDRQIRNMEATVDTYRSWIPRMHTDASAQDRIANDSSRSSIARAIARRRARSLREQIELTRNAIVELNRAIDDLRDAITTTNRHFWHMRNNVRATDTVFSRHIQSIDGDISAYIEKMEGIKNSFSEYGFEENWRLHFLNSVETMAVAFKESTTYAKLVLALQEGGIHIGRAVTASWRPQDIRNMLNGIRPNFIQDGARLPNMHASLNIRPGVRLLGNITRPLGLGLEYGKHFREHRDPGRALSFSLYVATSSGGTAFATYGVLTTVFKVGKCALAAKLWPIAVGYVAFRGAVRLYNNHDGVRERVDSFGDFINAIPTSPSPPPLVVHNIGRASSARAYLRNGSRSPRPQ